MAVRPPAPSISGSPAGRGTARGTINNNIPSDGSTAPGELQDPTDRDAYNRLKSILDAYGLTSLAPKILTYVQEGMSEDSIMLELQSTTEWKTRFSANEARRKAGLPVLNPAEYLATERSYRQIMQEAGVPSGFYDQTSDFTDFLTKDISPAELQGRVKSATDFVRAQDPAAVAYFKKFYTEGDMIAFALDPKRAAPLVGKAFEASTIGGIGAAGGLDLSKTASEQLAEAGVTADSARQGFAALSRDRGQIDLLTGIDGQQKLTADQLAQGTFLGNADVNAKVDRLKSRERARFGGSSGVGQGSLGSKSSGL